MLAPLVRAGHRTAHRLIATLAMMLFLALAARPAHADVALEAGSFQGQPDEERVILTWDTVSETETLEFVILRAESASMPREQRAEVRRIPGTGDPSGAHYTVADNSVQRGVTYYYWLEFTEQDGEVKLYGPVAVTPGETPKSTATATATPTATATITATGTLTPTATLSATATISATATVTPTVAPVPPTETPSPTLSPTLSPSPSSTPLIAATVGQPAESGLPSPTATPSPSPQPQPSPEQPASYPQPAIPAAPPPTPVPVASPSLPETGGETRRVQQSTADSGVIAASPPLPSVTPRAITPLPGVNAVVPAMETSGEEPLSAPLRPRDLVDVILLLLSSTLVFLGLLAGGGTLLFFLRRPPS